jgi:hypothetical protein
MNNEYKFDAYDTSINLKVSEKLNNNPNIYVIAALHTNFALTTHEPQWIYKVGYTDNMRKRMNSYFLHNPATRLVAFYYFEYAERVEKMIHSKYSSITRNEWYDAETILEITKELDSFKEML